MLADLASVIEELDLPFDGESLEEALALRDRLDARIVEATGAFEANGWWGGDASVSCVAWLRAHAKMTRRSAQRLRMTAVRLRALPVCARAYADGGLSGGQIEAIVARLDDDLVEVFAAHEAELVPYLIPLSVAGTSTAMGVWVTRTGRIPLSRRSPSGRSTSHARSTTAGCSTARWTPRAARWWLQPYGWPPLGSPTC